MKNHIKQALLFALVSLTLAGVLGACCPIFPSSPAEPADSGPLLPGGGAQLVPGSLGPQDPHIAFDSEGFLHLAWSQDGELLHKELPPEGSWSEPEVLTTDVETFFHISKLGHKPCGRICVFFEAATVSADPNTLGLYWRCQKSGQWSLLSEKYPHSEAPSGRSPHSPVCVPDNSIRVVHSSGRAPVK